MEDEFSNAIIAGTLQGIEDTLLESINLDELRLNENTKYVSITQDCQKLHAELLKHEREGRLGNYAENPTLVGDYLAKLRLNANQLFAFENIYIEILSDMQLEFAKKRQALYAENLVKKPSINAAEINAREMTRVDGAKIATVENCIKQIRNEYQRYNDICMFLQSKMKENNAERIMG